MSDEEFDDDEEWEPKKTKISLKSLLKGLGIMVIVVSGLLLMNMNYGEAWSMSVGFLLLCIGTFLINYKGKKKKKVKQVYTIYKCAVKSCGVKALHDYKEGDYVYKRIGPCFKCDEGTMYIDKIFAVFKREEDKLKVSRPIMKDPLDV